MKASNKGITVVSENGSETASVAEGPAKRRGRTRKTTTVEPDAQELEDEPPAKKRRGRPKKESTATVEPQEKEQRIVTPKKPRGSSRITPVVELPAADSAVILGSPVGPFVKDEADAGDEAEMEDFEPVSLAWSEPTPSYPSNARAHADRLALVLLVKARPKRLLAKLLLPCLLPRVDEPCMLWRLTVELLYQPTLVPRRRRHQNREA